MSQHSFKVSDRVICVDNIIYSFREEKVRINIPPELLFRHIYTIDEILLESGRIHLDQFKWWYRPDQFILASPSVVKLTKDNFNQLVKVLDI